METSWEYIQSEIPKCNSVPRFWWANSGLGQFLKSHRLWGWLGMYWGYDGILFHIQSTLFDMISYNMISFLMSNLFDMVNGLCNGMFVYNGIYIYRACIYHIYIGTYLHARSPWPLAGPWPWPWPRSRQEKHRGRSSSTAAGPGVECSLWHCGN